MYRDKFTKAADYSLDAGLDVLKGGALALVGALYVAQSTIFVGVTTALGGTLVNLFTEQNNPGATAVGLGVGAGIGALGLLEMNEQHLSGAVALGFAAAVSSGVGAAAYQMLEPVHEQVVVQQENAHLLPIAMIGKEENAEFLFAPI